MDGRFQLFQHLCCVGFNVFFKVVGGIGMDWGRDIDVMSVVWLPDTE